MRPYTREEFESTFWARVNKTEACWLWTGSRPQRYGSLGTRHFPGEQRAHRIAWLLTRGPIPDGMHLCHRCDNPPCCNPSHLFLGTQADNNSDKKAKGRASRLFGERNPKAKLTREKAAQILELKSDQYGAVSRVARQFSIARGVVKGIWTGKYWRQPDPIAPRLVVTVRAV